MTPAFVALAVLFVRLIVIMFEMFFKIIAFIFFVPLFRLPRRPRSYSTRSQPNTSFIQDVAMLIYVMRGGEPDFPGAERAKRRYPRPGYLTEYVPDEPVSAEESRNQKDCAVALKQLGYNQSHAERVAQEVVSQLGPHASLDDMVKRGLQIAKEVK